MCDTATTTIGTARAIMLGAPGSGKGTQAERLSAALGIPAISTGEMLRQAMEAGTPLGNRVSEIVNSGVLVDDGTMAEVVTDRLGEADAVNGFILDGFPRNVAQAERLDGILAELGAELDSVVYITVPEPELMRRALARQREDDTEEVIRHRLEVYRDSTSPLVNLYRGRGLLREVDGDQTIEEVLETILAALQGSDGDVN